jgi:hypothetical protein
MLVLSGIIAALLAYLCNKLALKGLGDRGILTLVPFIEEFFKTVAAIYLESSIVGVHFIFGCIEGLYDLATSSKKIGKWAALASVLSHSAFGGITCLVYMETSNIPASIFAAWIFHSSWNWYITKYV